MIGESWNNLSPEERMVCLSSMFVVFSFKNCKLLWFDSVIGLSKHWVERQGKIQARVERV